MAGYFMANASGNHIVATPNIMEVVQRTKPVKQHVDENTDDIEVVSIYINNHAILLIRIGKKYAQICSD